MQLYNLVVELYDADGKLNDLAQTLRHYKRTGRPSGITARHWGENWTTLRKLYDTTGELGDLAAELYDTDGKLNDLAQTLRHCK